jgi:hypothetical protein
MTSFNVTAKLISILSIYFLFSCNAGEKKNSTAGTNDTAPVTNGIKTSSPPDTTTTVTTITANDPKNVVTNQKRALGTDSTMADNNLDVSPPCAGNACGSVSYRNASLTHYFRNTGTRPVNVVLTNWAATETIPLNAGEEKSALLKVFFNPYTANYQ